MERAGATVRRDTLATDHHHACGHDHGPKHIYVYSPASAVRDKAAFRRAIARLKALGHEVEVDADALAAHTRFAGDDATRLAAIHRAAASGADVAMISRAAYGYTRILPGIQYRKVAKAIERGMRWIGMSDFTAFQSAVLARTGGVTWAGPSVEIDWGPKEQPDDIMAACFDDLLTGHGEGTGWRLTKEKPRADGSPAVPDLFIRSAPLWGGNLAVLTSLLGTPYFPQIKGGILFVEDISEHPYRIERMLTQLLYAGVLARQKAVVLGQFTQYRLAAHDKGYKLQSVVDWLRAQIKAPVLTGLPFGHVPTKVVLPVGWPVSLAVQGRDALMVWGHVH